MKNKIKKRVSDLGLAAALLHSGAILESLEPIDERRVAFVFQGENLDEIETRYWNRSLSSDSLGFFESIKRLKARLYSRN